MNESTVPAMRCMGWRRRGTRWSSLTQRLRAAERILALDPDDVLAWTTIIRRIRGRHGARGRGLLGVRPRFLGEADVEGSESFRGRTVRTGRQKSKRKTSFADRRRVACPDLVITPKFTCAPPEEPRFNALGSQVSLAILRIGLLCSG